MLNNNKVVAMILAGGKGTRLEALTKKTAKPAVSFAAKYRIIDFPLSNCANSGINVVGVLTQYESTELDSYIGNGEKWGLNGVHCLMSTLAPRQTEEGANWYKGTADAITQNIDFLDNANPEFVVILSGDHIYKTSYAEMINLHESSNADVTISVIEVDPSEASRFGILVADKNDKIVEFQEKPAHPTSNLASMGIYIFNYRTLRKALIKDAANENSDHDFGKNIIPMLLGEGKKLVAYKYKGYWKDVGTIKSLHEANMDLIGENTDLDFDKIMGGLKIYSADTSTSPQYIGRVASVSDSLINQGAVILGKVKKSVISDGVYIEKGAVVEHSVVMPGAKIEKNAVVRNAVVAPDSIVFADDEVIGEGTDIVLYSRKVKAHE